jgi:hypothetical protein
MWDINQNEPMVISNSFFRWAEKRILDFTGKRIDIEMISDSFYGDTDALMYADLRGSNKIANAISLFCNTEKKRSDFNSLRLTKILLNNQSVGNRHIRFHNNQLIISCAFANKEDHFSVRDLKNILDRQLRLVEERIPV